MESKIQRIIYKKDYPKLMQHIEKHNVVLFNSDREGFVVWIDEETNDGFHKLGHYSSNWMMHYFEDFKDKLTLEN